MSTKEKERLKSKEEAILAAREEREKQRRVTIDIAGRRVVESAFDEEDKGQPSLFFFFFFFLFFLFLFLLTCFLSSRIEAPSNVPRGG